LVFKAVLVALKIQMINSSTQYSNI